ncbi:hypothetical protein BSLG_005101 [Batrachochytrium salamandrivorans]|nr:hypothetical protein BSLG_005101 [Batrachochytrium salamandrivorans]
MTNATEHHLSSAIYSSQPSQAASMSMAAGTKAVPEVRAAIGGSMTNDQGFSIREQTGALSSGRVSSSQGLVDMTPEQQHTANQSQQQLSSDLDFWLTANFEDDDGFNRDVGLAGNFKMDTQFDMAGLIGNTASSQTASAVTSHALSASASASQYIASLIASSIKNQPSTSLQIQTEAENNLFFQQLLASAAPTAPFSTSATSDLASFSSSLSSTTSAVPPFQASSAPLHVPSQSRPSFPSLLGDVLVDSINPVQPTTQTLEASMTHPRPTPPAVDSEVTPGLLSSLKGKLAPKDIAESEDLNKRRRNTAASARFRAKKKAREQAVENTAKSMTDRVQHLEDRLRAQDMEIRWLRHLVTDRDNSKSLASIYEENGLKLVSGTSAYMDDTPSTFTSPTASVKQVRSIAAAEPSKSPIDNYPIPSTYFEMASTFMEDPFGQYFPETIFDRLADEEAATTTTCAYNRRANLVAAGTRDGRCLIWDLDTRAMALRLKGHAQPITSVSWTRRGRHVLTSSRDWNCILWDLKTSARRHTVKFTSPVLESQMHPRNKDMFVALAQGDPPSLVQFSKVPGEPPRRIALDMNDTTGLIPGDVESCLKGPAPDIYATTVIFSSDGELIFVGTKKGHISVFESKNGQLKAILRVGTSAVKQVCCSRDGRNLLVNSHDRIIRSFSLKFLDDNTIEFELLNKYQDSVDRNQWTKCCFSSDGDLVVGALSSSQKHNIFIWDKVMGNLVKMLEGPREGLVDMVWHPTRPVIATVSHFGVIYFWGVCYTQNFSAFSPFFTELDDNKEYLEQEDEFDQDSDEDKNAGLAPPRSPMLNVDVVTKDFRLAVRKGAGYIGLFEYSPSKISYCGVMLTAAELHTASDTYDDDGDDLVQVVQVPFRKRSLASIDTYTSTEAAMLSTHHQKDEQHKRPSQLHQHLTEEEEQKEEDQKEDQKEEEEDQKEEQKEEQKDEDASVAAPILEPTTIVSATSRVQHRSLKPSTVSNTVTEADLEFLDPIHPPSNASHGLTSNSIPSSATGPSTPTTRSSSRANLSYRSFRLNDMVYTAGDTVLISSQNTQIDHIMKLTRIEQCRDGSNELLYSKDFDKIDALLLIGKCTVMSEADFFSTYPDGLKQTDVNEPVMFCRKLWDARKLKILDGKRRKLTKSKEMNSVVYKSTPSKPSRRSSTTHSPCPLSKEKPSKKTATFNGSDRIHSESGSDEDGRVDGTFSPSDEMNQIESSHGTGSESEAGSSGVASDESLDDESDDDFQNNRKRSNRKSIVRLKRKSPVKPMNLKRLSSRAKAMEKRLKQLPTKLPDRVGDRQEAETDAARAIELLHVGAIPESLPGREEEFALIYTHVENAILENSGTCIYVSGVPGTGKTATFNAVLRTLQEQTIDESILPFDFIEINGMKLTEPSQAYVALWQGLTGEKVTAKHAQVLLQTRFTTSSPNRQPCVVLMDELDMLVTKTQTNTMDLPERMLSNKISSRLGLTRITFQPYTHKQLFSIVEARLISIKSFDRKAIELCARKVGGVSGDARRALDICKRAVELFESTCKGSWRNDYDEAY